MRLFKNIIDYFEKIEKLWESRNNELKRMIIEIGFNSLKETIDIKMETNKTDKIYVNEVNKLVMIDKYINKGIGVGIFKFKEEVSKSLSKSYNKNSVIRKELDLQDYYNTSIGQVFESDKISFSIEPYIYSLCYCTNVYINLDCISPLKLEYFEAKGQGLNILSDSEYFERKYVDKLKKILIKSEIKNCEILGHNEICLFKGYKIAKLYENYKRGLKQII